MRVTLMAKVASVRSISPNPNSIQLSRRFATVVATWLILARATTPHTRHEHVEGGTSQEEVRVYRYDVSPELVTSSA